MLILVHNPTVDCGLYALTLRVNSGIRIRVGALGILEFASGYYVYCGSARRGPNSRLRRHVAPKKKKRWHIDYLTSCREVTVEAIQVFPVGDITECQLNERTANLPGATRIRGFGCSDCRCSSHLSYHGSRPPTMKREKYDRIIES